MLKPSQTLQTQVQPWVGLMSHRLCLVALPEQRGTRSAGDVAAALGTGCAALPGVLPAQPWGAWRVSATTSAQAQVAPGRGPQPAVGFGLLHHL